MEKPITIVIFNAVRTEKILINSKTDETHKYHLSNIADGYS